eukprot:61229-Rhodomonas_salina.1
MDGGARALPAGADGIRHVREGCGHVREPYRPCEVRQGPARCCTPPSAVCSHWCCFAVAGKCQTNES